MNELVKLIKVGFYLFQEAPFSSIDEFPQIYFSCVHSPKFYILIHFPRFINMLNLVFIEHAS
jgi:hypothetical protein